MRARTSLSTLVDVENAKPKWLIVSAFRTVHHDPLIGRCDGQLNVGHQHHIADSAVLFGFMSILMCVLLFKQGAAIHITKLS